MKMRGSIFAFINFEQAARFGHVGWGFQLDDKSYCYGSTDHLWRHDWWDLPAWLRYMNVPESADIDWWSERGSKDTMLRTMKSGPHIRYHAYKEVGFDESSPGKALLIAEGLREKGWRLADHNCVHQTFKIFTGYNSEHNLPDPFADPLNMIPKNWFAKIEADSTSL